jgi:porin
MRAKKLSGSVCSSVAGFLVMGALVAGVAHAASPANPSSTSIWAQETLTGDWGGARTDLSEKGIDVSLSYTGESFSVLSGGLEQRNSYEGRAELSLDADLQKLMNWSGATAHFTLYNIHDGGRNVAENTGSIADPSNIDALHTTRLFTAWLEQSLFDDHFSVRLGQLAADDEFLASDTAGGLLNGTFGWAGILAANITNGGPAYPLAAPGVRLKFQASDNLAFLAGAFAGDPAGDGCDDDAQRCNRRGTRFSTHGGTLWLGEMQYGVNQADAGTGLPGLYKLGVWYANGTYADQRYGYDALNNRVPVADPAFDHARNYKNNWGIYGVMDQTVWQGASSRVNTFLRGGFSPADRNLLSYYIDGGVGITGPFTGRPNDTLTLGVAYARISPDVIRSDQDALAINGAPYAVRDKEMVFELGYTAQLTPWWTLQPDIQYIVHPNGGQDPDDPARRIGHAFLVGLRTSIAF